MNMNKFTSFSHPDDTQHPLLPPPTPTFPPVPTAPLPLLLAIAPHILLPALLFTSYLPPPSRLRAPTFLLLFALLQYLCTTSPWPSNAPDPDGSARSLRYGLACTWIFVLPVVQRIVCQVPEREFWRVDDVPPGGGVPAPPKEWSWEKVRWAMNLVSTPRGVGWNFGGRGVNAAREGIRRKGMERSRGRFVVGALARAATCWVVWDGLILGVQKATEEGRVPTGWGWSWETLREVGFADLCMLGIPWAGMTMQFEVGTALGVGLGINAPEDWPPLFGDVVGCWTVGKVWGGFWHQYLRQPCLGFSRRINEVLRIPRGSTLAYFVHLVTAFAISAFCHILSLAPLCPGWYPFRTLVSDMCIFFLMQPFGTMFEVGVMALFARYVWKQKPAGQVDVKPQVPVTDTPTESVTVSPLGVKGGIQDFGRRNKDVFILAACRLVGYIWVIVWFWGTSWWFVKAYLGVGMAGWQFPFSFLAWLVIPGR